MSSRQREREVRGKAGLAGPAELETPGDAGAPAPLPGFTDSTAGAVLLV